jgi:hypothetical protein
MIMSKSLNKEIIDLVMDGKFDSAYSMVKELDLSEIIDEVVMEPAFDTNDYVYYRFAVYLENHFDSSDVAYQVARLVSTALARTPGAYHLAAHHALRAVRERGNLLDLDIALFISQTPCRPIDEHATISICKKIIEKDEDHQEARNVLRKIQS